MPKKNFDSYHTFIVYILKCINPDLRITDKAKDVVNDLVSQVFIDIKKRAIELTHLSEAKTISERSIKFAGLLELNPHFGSDCIKAGLLAMMRYYSSTYGFNQEDIDNIELIKPFLTEYPHLISDVEFNRRKALYSDKAKIPSEINAGLAFKIGRLQRQLKTNTECRLSIAASIRIAAILELVTAKILQSAENRLRGVVTITPRHIMLGIKDDEDLRDIFRHTIIAEAGVPQHIYKNLL